MKKLLSLIIICIFIFSVTACSKNEKLNTNNKTYTINGSIGYGCPEGKGIEETEISYEMIIAGKKDDILNIETNKPLINPEYVDLLLKDGPHHTETSENQDFLKVTGSFIFNTSGKTKEEISEMSFYKGAEIYDKNGTKHELILNSYVGK